MKGRAGAHPKRPQLAKLWNALDEAAFGAERILNLRELLPSGAEARARAEVWLKARQVTRTEDVLVITGRGNQSAGGVGVIRQEILALMPVLRKRGVVESWKEHSPGSIVIKLAPVNALLSAPRRHRRRDEAEAESHDESAFVGLRKETLGMLRDLAAQNLVLLGVVPSEEFIIREMTRTFSALVNELPSNVDREEALGRSIRKAIEESGGNT